MESKKLSNATVDAGQEKMDKGLSRRDFLVTAAGLSVATLAGCAHTSLSAKEGANVVGQERLRVGLIGCGGRGTGAAVDCANADPAVVIVAMGDLFPDRLEGSRNNLREKLGDRFQVTQDTCFTGFDAYKKVLACDVDVVILATPPAFRPQQLRAAIDANKHVFMEKPVCVDPIGARSVIETAALAEAKGLSIVAGTQRRHDPMYIETMRRIHDGAIGEIVAAQCYWCMGDLWVIEKTDKMSAMEWQIRNWLYFDWLSGDHIVEQHVHNLDVVNWAIGGPPVKAFGMGGRQVRTDPKFGNVFDHFSIEYEYANGARVQSFCRQTGGTSDRVSERLVGTKGTSDPHGQIMGKHAFEYPQQENPVNPYVQEHVDLIASIRNGEPLNEAKRVAESTLTAIMGRMSAYTGREISWKWLMNASKLDLVPKTLAFGEHAYNPVSVPGKTPLV